MTFNEYGIKIFLDSHNGCVEKSSILHYRERLSELREIDPLSCGSQSSPERGGHQGTHDHNEVTVTRSLQPSEGEIGLVILEGHAFYLTLDGRLSGFGGIGAGWGGSFMFTSGPNEHLFQHSTYQKAWLIPRWSTDGFTKQYSTCLLMLVFSGNGTQNLVDKVLPVG
jgi:hypothetical protein